MTHHRITAPRSPWGSNLKTVVGGRRLSFNREKHVPLKAFYPPLQQSWLASSYPAWCWNYARKWTICSKENITKLTKNCKILTELVGRRQGEGSGFLSFSFSWDHWHAMRWFLWPSLWITVSQQHESWIIPCVGRDHKYHLVPAPCHGLGPLTLDKSSKPPPTWPWILPCTRDSQLVWAKSHEVLLFTKLLYFYHDTCIYNHSLSEYLKLGFQILVEPLARHLDGRKKKFWILLDIHIYPQAAIKWDMRVSAKLRRK